MSFLSKENGGQVDEEYIPTLEEVKQFLEDNEEDFSEGADEGSDSVLVWNRKMGGANEQMNTTDRAVTPSYHLRSLEESNTSTSSETDPSKFTSQASAAGTFERLDESDKEISRAASG